MLPNFIVMDDYSAASYAYSSSLLFTKVSYNIYSITPAAGGTLTGLPSWVLANKSMLWMYSPITQSATHKYFSIINKSSTSMTAVLYCDEDATDRWPNAFTSSTSRAIYFRSLASHGTTVAKTYCSASGVTYDKARFVYLLPYDSQGFYPYQDLTSSVNLSCFTASFFIAPFANFYKRNSNRLADYMYDQWGLITVSAHGDNAYRRYDGDNIPGDTNYSMCIDTGVNTSAGNPGRGVVTTYGPQLEYYSWAPGHFSVCNSGSLYYTSSQKLSPTKLYDAYLLSSSACAGAWAGKENNVAVLVNQSPETWHFIAPGYNPDGAVCCLFYNNTTYYYYNKTTGHWQTTAPSYYVNTASPVQSWSTPTIAGYLQRIMSKFPSLNIYDARQLLREHARHNTSKRYDSATTGWQEIGGFGYVDYLTFLSATASVANMGIGSPTLKRAQKGPDRVDFYWRNNQQSTFARTIISEFPSTFTFSRNTPPTSGSIIYQGTGSYYHYAYTHTGSVVYTFHTQDIHGKYSLLEHDNLTSEPKHIFYYDRFPFTKTMYIYRGAIKMSVNGNKKVFPLVTASALTNNQIRVYNNGQTLCLFTDVDHDMAELAEPDNLKFMYKQYTASFYGAKIYKMNIKSFDPAQIAGSKWE